MKLWIRLDASLPRDPEVAELAERVGVKKAEAIGLLACVWSAVAEHRPSGDVSGISAATLEDWAEFEPRGKVKRGTFAAAFTSLFVKDGMVRGWKERQGKLIERMEKDRKRKQESEESANNSTEIPQTFHGNSAPTLRNGTEQDETEETKSPSPSTSARESVIGKLPPEYRPDLEAFLKSLGAVHRQDSWVRNIDAIMSGMGEPAVKPTVVGAAIRQLVGNGEKANWVLFKGYLRREAAPLTSVQPRANGVAQDVKGAAMLILGELRLKRQAQRIPDGGTRYLIPQTEVEGLPPAASRALSAIGGVGKLANADDKQYGFLISQFATAYAGAIAEEKSRLGAVA